jgi:hypothetical protein
MLSSLLDFNIITPPKPITEPTLKIYAAIVATPVNKQVENIKKVYSEKMAKLDRDLSQKAKRHENEEKQMKYVITQLVRQKQELEEKLSKNATTTPPTSKPSTPSKPITTKTTTLPSSPTLKKPSTAIQSNVKYTPLNHSKEALTLKSFSYIKFNQIQIEQIETKIFNTPTPKQGDIIQKEIKEINNLEINTPSPRPNEIKITFSTPEPLSQTVFTASEPLLPAPPVDSLLIKRKWLSLSKHKINTENIAFAFNKPSPTNSPEYIGIDKPKEIIKKNKPLNKNTEILEFLFNQKDNNNNNDNKPKNYNTENIFDPKNMEYTTLPKPTHKF